MLGGELKASTEKMTRAICGVLFDNKLSVYLYGSVAYDDFRLGWSDIDILALTEREIAEKQAEKLVTLQQTMLSEEPGNPYYRSFEGGMLTLGAFLSGRPDRVVYWGTSGQRIDTCFRFDSFSTLQLLERGILLYGDDVRNTIETPTFDALKSDIAFHLDSIRKYAHLSGRSLYSFGWLLDISRCIYTLRTGKIIAKTAAGEWALREGVCPVPETLEFALNVRRSPLGLKDDDSVLAYAASVNGDVQRYADVLEAELAAK